jgi:23S rRNA pseudouridine2605 synthase
MKIRLQKILADHGISSRRGSEDLIAAGEVTINGKVARLGDKAVAGVDHIKVRGKLLKMNVELVVYALFKPRGFVCQISDGAQTAEGTVHELVSGINIKLIPVPKLDKDAEGLVLLTNDGDLAERINRPKFEVPKTYEVKIDGSLDDSRQKRLLNGVPVEGKRIKVSELRILKTSMGKQWVHIATTDSQNRQIRKLFEAVGRPVDKVKRIQIGEVRLGGLDRGSFRRLRKEEIEKLYAFVGLKHGDKGEA